MNVLSLFSGIGGLDLGLQRAGMTIAGQVEIDPWCRKILAKHWPEVPRHDDVRTAARWWLGLLAGTERDRLERGQHPFSGERTPLVRRRLADADSPLARAAACADAGRRPAVDLVCGGFPCQPVSLAGKGLAQADSRWLWPAFAHVIRCLRPRYVLVENVPGLLGRGMGDVLGDLAVLGYDGEWDCVPAAFVGAPHIRNRVWIVAYPNRGRLEEQQECHRRPLTGVGASLGHNVVGLRDHLADTERPRSQESARAAMPSERRPSVFTPASHQGQRGHWAAEPGMGRVAHGIPARVDRLRGLGNAVVPQVAEHIGRLIMNAAAA